MMCLLFVLAFVSCGAPSWAENVPEPEGYKLNHYRGPVPATLKGAVVIESETAFALWHSKRISFVDVLPQAPKPKNLLEDTIWRDKPKHSIPNAIWLPNVGYGRIADSTADYFKEGLVDVSKDDLNHPMVFFCLKQCWMSWNAAKRAVEYGYTTVYWFPEGTDGWDFYDYPTELVKAFVQ